MTLVCVGFDRRTAPASFLEEVTIENDRLNEVLDHLIESEHITEAVVLSSCMRTDVYVEALRFHAAVEHIITILAKSFGVSEARLSAVAVERFDSLACDHLFRVAAGLESPVLGEYEILGQVGRALETAKAHGTARTVMEGLFRHALASGRKARSETGIAKGTTSIGKAAVDMAQAEIGDLHGRQVLVIGAGEMGEAMAVAVSYSHLGTNIAICNRTIEKAEELAVRVHGRAVSLSDLSSELLKADVVLSGTAGASDYFDHERVDALMTLRDRRPLVLVDMGLPHNVDPRAGAIENVSLLDLDDLQKFTAANRAEREQEVEAVETIIENEVSTYLREIDVRSLSPLITKIYENAEGVRQSELNRFDTRLSGLSPEQRASVEAMTASLVAKLLHAPVARMKASAGSSEGDYFAEAMRLFLDR